MGSHPGTKLYKLSDPMTSSRERKGAERGQVVKTFSQRGRYGSDFKNYLLPGCQYKVSQQYDTGGESQSRLHLSYELFVHYILYLVANSPPHPPPIYSYWSVCKPAGFRPGCPVCDITACHLVVSREPHRPAGTYW